tara:strand:+ start:4632 stop:5069 length:438 start_codon:yes stop_codon:yes gene_type:complete
MRYLFLTLSLLMFLGGCAPQQLYQRRDLQEALLKHHQNFRWGRITQASTLVQPKLQQDFVQSWMERFHELELHNVEVLGMAEQSGGDVVEVSVRLQWINHQTMNVKSRLLTEIWVRTPDGWQLAAPIFPRDLFAQPQREIGLSGT